MVLWVFGLQDVSFGRSCEQALQITIDDNEQVRAMGATD